MKDLFAQRVADTCMAYDEFEKLEKRKVNQGFFRERPYFISASLRHHRVVGRLWKGELYAAGKGQDFSLHFE
jgi:hypothetical protein